MRLAANILFIFAILVFIYGVSKLSASSKEARKRQFGDKEKINLYDRESLLFLLVSFGMFLISFVLGFIVK